MQAKPPPVAARVAPPFPIQARAPEHAAGCAHGGLRGGLGGIGVDQIAQLL